MNLGRKLAEGQDPQTARAAYGIMASATTVNIEGSSTAVTATQVDSVGPLASGDHVMLSMNGADIVITGVFGGSLDRFNYTYFDSDFTVTSGWSLTAATAYRNYNMMSCAIYVTRTGSAISVPASGNIANTAIGTFDAALRGTSAMNQALTSVGTGRVLSGYVDPATGFVAIAAAGGTSDIANGEAISLGGFVFLGD